MDTKPSYEALKQALIVRESEQKNVEEKLEEAQAQIKYLKQLVFSESVRVGGIIDNIVITNNGPKVRIRWD